MTLYAWPPKTLVNRVIPKTKLYVNARLSSALRQAIVSDVQQIIWRAKMAPETLHLSATDDVPEIQVIEIVMRKRDIHEGILAVIDRAIPFPIVFELVYAGHMRMAAAWKRRGTSEGKWLLSDYLFTRWMPGDSPRKGLPIALDLGGLYLQILTGIAPYPPRTGESLPDYFERLRRIRALEKGRERLEKQMIREKQFNRKVEINAQVRAIQREIGLLTTTACSEEDTNELEKTSN